MNTKVIIILCLLVASLAYLFTTGFCIGWGVERVKKEVITIKRSSSSNDCATDTITLHRHSPLNYDNTLAMPVFPVLSNESADSVLQSSLKHLSK